MKLDDLKGRMKYFRATTPSAQSRYADRIKRRQESRTNELVQPQARKNAESEGEHQQQIPLDEFTHQRQQASQQQAHERRTTAMNLELVSTSRRY